MTAQGSHDADPRRVRSCDPRPVSATRVPHRRPRVESFFGLAAILAASLACRRDVVEPTGSPTTTSQSSAPAGPSPDPRDAPTIAATDVDPPQASVEASDRCPGEAETINGYLDGDGCPDALPDDLAAITGVLADVAFDIEKDTLKRPSFAALDRIAAVLKKYPDVSIEIGGHEDARPDHESYSRCLTCRRADAIERYFVHSGIEAVRLRSQGYGATRPIDTNRTEAGRRRNRRVEIRILDPGGRPFEPVVPSGDAGCVDRRTARRADGGTENCYPYACRAGACLKSCREMKDCAGAHVPGEMASEGWPLECMPSGQCTPMHPDKVH